MSDGSAQDMVFPSSLRIEDQEFRLEDRTATDIIYHTTSLAKIAGHHIGLLLVFSFNEGWHVGLLLEKDPLAFFDGIFASAEDAVDMATTFMNHPANIQNIVKMSHRVKDPQVLMIECLSPDTSD